MMTERDIEVMREKLFDFESRLSSLEAWQDNERAKISTAPAWLFGILSACVGIATLLFNLYLAGGRP